MMHCSAFRTALERCHSLLTAQWLFSQRPKNAEGAPNERETARGKKCLKHQRWILVFALQKNDVFHMHQFSYFSVDVGPGLLLVNIDWSTCAGPTPFGNSQTKGKFSISHHCDVCCY